MSISVVEVEGANEKFICEVLLDILRDKERERVRE